MAMTYHPHKSTAPKQDPPPHARQARAATASRRDRDRRRVERQVNRALSDRRAIAVWVVVMVSSQVFRFALLAANIRLTLIFGLLLLGSFAALCAHVEPPPDPGPKGEIAKMPEPEFERLVAVVEAARSPTPARADRALGAERLLLDEDGFAHLVAEALDDLPEAFRIELERNVPVVIADDGHSHFRYGAYGMYMGATIANPGWLSRILIFRDTIVRDFGDDPIRLKEIVTMVVRHELAHHLGASERHIAELGLSDIRPARQARPFTAPIAFDRGYVAPAHTAAVPATVSVSQPTGADPVYRLRTSADSTTTRSRRQPPYCGRPPRHPPCQPRAPPDQPSSCVLRVARRATRAKTAGFLNGRKCVSG